MMIIGTHPCPGETCEFTESIRTVHDRVPVRLRVTKHEVRIWNEKRIRNEEKVEKW